jgi:lysophospholipase L1-like esterase
MERLAPDILVLYIGHNDILTASPVPYRDLYAHYRAPRDGARRISQALEASRFYVGARFALLGLRARGGAVGVPIPHADENVSALVALAAAAQPPARVLLVSEGLAPDGTAMRSYAQMLASHAHPDRVAFLDAADAFHRAGEPDLFLDDCHLSVRGHARLAGWIREALAAQGWLEQG